MGFFEDLGGFMINPVGAGLAKLTGQDPLVGAFSPSVALSKAGIEKWDEVSGNKANREQQKKLMEQQKAFFEEEKARREKAEADYKFQREISIKAQTQAAAENAKRRRGFVDAPSTKGGTILTGSLGLPPSDVKRRSILGA